MALTLKSKLQSIKNIKISRFNLALLGIFVLVNAVLLGVGIGLYTYRYSMEFVKANVLQLIVIFILAHASFYFTYQNMTKKSPSIWLLAGFFILLSVSVFIMSGTGFLVERLAHRATFGLSSSLVIMIGTLLFGLLLGRYDFPLVESKEKMYLVIEDHFMKNIGVYLVLFFLIAWAGLVNGVVTPLVMMVIFFVNLYISKVILSNFRR